MNSLVPDGVTPLRAALVVVLFWALIYLPGLGTPELKGEEGRRILPALHMIESGDWLVPFSEGKPYWRKPPMINWSVAGAFLVTSVENEWTARMPSALSVLALALAALVFSRGLLGDRGAFAAALCVLLNIALLEKGRLIEIEALYVALHGIAFLVWLHLWVARSSPWLTNTLPWIFLGLAMLTKGPSHLLFYLPIVIFVHCRSGRARELRHPSHLAGLAILAALYYPWSMAARQRAAQLYADLESTASSETNLWNQLSERLFVLPDMGEWVFEFLKSLVHFLPWLVVLLFWRKTEPPPEQPQRGLYRGLAHGILVGFLLVSIIPGAQARFVSPLVAPVCVLVPMVHARLPESIRDKLLRAWTVVCRVLAIVLAIAALVLPFALDLPGSGWRAASGLAAGALAVWLLLRLKNSGLVPMTGLCACLAIAVYVLAVLPEAARHDDVRPVGEKISAAIPGGERLLILKPGPQHFIFYIRSNYTIASKLRFLDGAEEFLLVPDKYVRYAAVTERVAEHGYELVFSVEDKSGKEYHLMRRP